MRLLYVCEDVPTLDPRDGSGSSLMSYELLRSWGPDVEVTLLTYAASEVPEAVSARCESVHLLPRRRHTASVARAVLTGAPVGVVERTSAVVGERLRQLSAHADVTLLHGPHVAHLAGAASGPMVIQVVDPWSHRMAMEAHLVVPWRVPLRRREQRWARAVEQALPERARLLTVSPDDADSWSRELHGRPVRSIPNGLRPATEVWRRPLGPPTVCFTGSLDYAPNIDAATRLVKDIAPLVWREEPTTHFVLAGRRAGPRVLRLQEPRVRVAADVSDLAQVLTAAHVAAFPDRAGVGMRNSVAEALALGLPVVASALAARGFADAPGLTVRTEDEALAQAVVDALRRRPRGRPTHVLRGWAAVAEEYRRELLAAMETCNPSDGPLTRGSRRRLPGGVASRA